jgi:phosphoserine aminotransferase
MMIYNFGAGPAKIPEAVLQRAHAEFFDWGHTGMSVMEIGHRTSVFMTFAEQTESLVRQLLDVPQDYRILFLSGGASSQFAMVPMNLLGHTLHADYLVSGIWSAKAAKEAEKFATIHRLYDYEREGYEPLQNMSWSYSPYSAYTYYTANETISGVCFPDIPHSGDNPLVSDLSSILFSKRFDLRRFDCVFACAQKNFGQAGITLVIIREASLGHALPQTPTMFDYQQHAHAHSLLNTPPTYAWYIAHLCFEWMIAQGGVEVLAAQAQTKAALLYQTIDASDFYNNSVPAALRSCTNIPFSLPKTELEPIFVTEAAKEGLMNLKGHRLQGGIRASIYNAMPLAGVEALVAFMAEFGQRYG